VGIAADLVHPECEFASSLISGAIFQHAHKNLLDKVFADVSIPGQPQEEVEKRDVVFLEEDSQFFDLSYFDILHQSVIRVRIHHIYSLVFSVHSVRLAFQKKVTRKGKKNKIVVSKGFIQAFRNDFAHLMVFFAFPRRPTVSDSLEERFVKANLQWSLQPSLKTIFIMELGMPAISPS
jgi:hypothetical protein